MGNSDAHITSSSTHYNVAPLASPPTSSDVQTYRETRLTALRIDPTCFSSTCEREVAFSEETWKARLTGTGGVTLTARHATVEMRVGGIGGILTVIAAGNIPASTYRAGMNLEKAYLVFGMWIHLEHRRRGVGRMLLESAVKRAVEDATRANRSEEVEIWLAVAKDNMEAGILIVSCGGFHRC